MTRCPPASARRDGTAPSKFLDLMSPLAGLVLSIVTLLTLTLAILSSGVSPAVKVAFAVLAAGGIGLAVARFREQRR